MTAGGDWHLVPGTFLTPGCETWQKDVRDGHLTVIVGKEPEGWHLSISHRTNSNPPRPGRNPKWNEIKQARYRFTPADVTMCMILPPPDEFVNVMETCFHLWEHPSADNKTLCQESESDVLAEINQRPREKQYPGKTDKPPWRKS